MLRKSCLLLVSSVFHLLTCLELYEGMRYFAVFVHLSGQGKAVCQVTGSPRVVPSLSRFFVLSIAIEKVVPALDCGACVCVCVCVCVFVLVS